VLFRSDRTEQPARQVHFDGHHTVIVERLLDHSPTVYQAETAPLTLPVRLDVGFDNGTFQAAQHVRQALVGAAAGATVGNSQEVECGKANRGRDFPASVSGFDQLANTVDPQILVVDGRAAGCTGQHSNSMAVTLIDAHALVTGAKREQWMLHAGRVVFERGIDDVGYEEIALPATVRREACGGLVIHALDPALVRCDEHGSATLRPPSRDGRLECPTTCASQSIARRRPDPRRRSGWLVLCGAGIHLAAPSCKSCAHTAGSSPTASFC